MCKYGLKFTPVPRENLTELRSDIRKFCRKLRLIEFFHNKTPSTDEHDIAKPESSFTPSRHRDIILDTYIDFLLKHPLQSSDVDPVKNNLNKMEWEGIMKLKKDDTVVIKECDKGGACVIMDAKFYYEKMCNILDDKETYKKLDKNIDNKTMTMIENLTEKYKEALTKKEIDYLTGYQNKTSNLYGLPKVHKSKIIGNTVKNSIAEVIELPNPQDLTFRPIVAGPNCVTSKLSDFIDRILKPFLPKVKSYIKDDLEFLNKIPTELKEYECLVTLDITNMYTNIDNDLGLIAIKYWLQQYPELIVRNLPSNFICEALTIILQYNTFIFNQVNYIQIRGTAMGTKVAPTYVTLVMGYLENKLYNIIENKYGLTHKNKFFTSWKRYLDDCFIIWDERIDKVDNLFEILQNLHTSIKFTIESSKTSIHFLDIYISVNDYKISTDIYRKPTDSQQYVHFKSCHPPHTKQNIPFNLARRICTIVENKELRNRRLVELQTNLTKQGYPETLTQNCIARSDVIPLTELRKEKEPKSNDNKILAFVSTYNPRNPNFFSIIKKTFLVLNASPKMQEAIKHLRLINSYRQPPSLKKILTRAKFTYTESAHNIGVTIINEKTVTKCNDKKCGTCPLITTTNAIMFKNGEIPFKIKSNMNCNAKNVIYLIRCSGCNKEYIGQTSNLRARVRIHKQQILNPNLRTLYVSKHIAHCSIGEDIPFTITPFLTFDRNDVIEREEKENYFIQKYTPELNRD